MLDVDAEGKEDVGVDELNAFIIFSACCYRAFGLL